MRALFYCGIGVLFAAGCSGTKPGNGFGSPDGGLIGSSSSGGGNGSSGGTFGGSSGNGSGSGSGGNGCSGQATDYVYVLSAENVLYSFAPAAKKFTQIGPLKCQTAMQPNSMAVDRNAVAYVNYVQSDPTTGLDSAGAIYQVSTQDASCSSAPVMSLTSGWFRIGMGYSSNNAGSSAETLYVAGVGNAGGSGKGLGLVDFGKGVVGGIGPFTGTLKGQNAELTGTGDGRLYGFFTSSPVRVAQIDKSTGGTQTPVTMTGVQVPNDWAFSFWGGHFYLYTSLGQGTGNGSDVTDYDPVSGSINTTYMTGIGFDIVGAGVSTCAPVTAPQ
ncbi:MAG TPA: hypothetical protein VIF09_28110 [Polyangiaceae bacterium]